MLIVSTELGHYSFSSSPGDTYCNEQQQQQQRNTSPKQGDNGHASHNRRFCLGIRERAQQSKTNGFRSSRREGEGKDITAVLSTLHSLIQLTRCRQSQSQSFRFLINDSATVRPNGFLLFLCRLSSTHSRKQQGQVKLRISSTIDQRDLYWRVPCW